MEVYRYISEEELNKIKADDMKTLGRIYNEGCESNTHKYRQDVYYVHFFKSLKNIQRIQMINQYRPGKYIAKFDIPFSLIIRSMGFGYYKSPKYSSGYDYLVDKVFELAVESEKLKPSYFVDAVKDVDGKMTAKQAEEKFKEQSQTVLGD